MANENKTKKTKASVLSFVSSLEDEQVISDCHELIRIMKDVSGHDPKMWGSNIIGFDSYHYKYESGREGDSCIIGFSPRKGKITVYLVDGTSRYPELFAKLGKHTTGKVCVYFKRLSDINTSVLTELIERSYAYTKSLDGQMHRAE